jgi:hypothetical protein
MKDVQNGGSPSFRNEFYRLEFFLDISHSIALISNTDLLQTITIARASTANTATPPPDAAPIIIPEKL